MTFGIGLLIFLVAIIALVSEVSLYLMLGVATAFRTSAETSSLVAIALGFTGLMVLTATIGLLSPICGFIGTVTKRERMASALLVVLTVLVGGVYGVGLLTGTAKSLTAKMQNQQTIAEPSSNAPAAKMVEDLISKLSSESSESSE